MRFVVKLSEHRRGRRFDGYKKNIGNHTFYFGSGTPRAEAERRALSIMAFWSDLNGRGVRSWTTEFVEAAKATAEGRLPAREMASPSLAPLNGAHVVAAVDSNLTFHAAVTEFQGYARKNALWSVSWRNSLPAWVQPVKKALGDIPLRSIGFEQVSSLAAALVKRAIEAEVSATTSKNSLVAARSLFEWLSDTGKWPECPKLEKIWRKHRQVLKRYMPITNGVIDTYSLEDLNALYGAANQSERTYLLCGLLLGWTQMDIATATRSMFHVSSETPYVERRRSKTGVPGRWIIPTEFARILELRISHTSKDSDCVFLSETGTPLMGYNAKGARIDLIRNSWERLLDRVKVKRLSFKYLRKTGSQFVRHIAGLEASQAFLAHADSTVAGKHYNSRDLNRLETALRDFHRLLAPMFGQSTEEKAD